MSTIAAISLALCACVASALLTAVVRRYAIRSALVDIPNSRSSHARPTPRGGGLAVALVILAGLIAAWAFGALATAPAVALLGGGVVVAAIGWRDDHRDLSPRIRLIAQFAAAIWALVWLGGLPELRWGSTLLHLGWTGYPLGALAIVWSINAYNFMDGIDGIAGAEAVSVGLVGAGLLLVEGHSDLAVVALLIAGASFGFLLWNWAPAKIFLGDVGSGLLGFLFAALALASEHASAVPAFAWVLLCGVFMFDAMVTLVRRAARKERVQQAHRSHAYQRLVIAGWSHARVVSAVLVINLLLAVLVVTGTQRPQLWTPLAIAGVVLLACCYGAVERLHPMSHSSRGGQRRASLSHPAANISIASPCSPEVITGGSDDHP